MIFVQDRFLCWFKASVRIVRHVSSSDLVITWILTHSSRLTEIISGWSRLITMVEYDRSRMSVAIHDGRNGAPFPFIQDLMVFWFIIFNRSNFSYKNDLYTNAYERTLNEDSNVTSPFGTCILVRLKCRSVLDPRILGHMSFRKPFLNFLLKKQ